MPKLKVTLGIGISNCRQEDVIDIDDEDWIACKTEEERDALKHDYWKDWIWEHVDGCAVIVEDE